MLTIPLKEKDALGSTFVAVFLLFSFFSRAFSIPTLAASASVGIVGILSLLYAMASERQSPVPANVLVFDVLASLVMLASLVYNGNSGIEDIAWVWTYSGPVAILLTKTVDYRYIMVAFYLVAGYVLFNMVRGVDSVHVLASTGRNYISASIVLLVVLLYMLQKIQTNHIALLPALVAAAVCVYGSGRSGALTATLLLLIVFSAYLFSEKKMPIAKIMIVIVFSVGAVFLAQALFGNYIDSLLSRFEREGLNTPRLEIWSEYLGAVLRSVPDFLLGAPADYTTGLYVARYGGNLHNAFLMLHARTGLIGFLFVAIGLFAAVSKLIREKEYFICGLIAVLVFRSMFDWLAFPGQYDVVYLSLIFSAIIKCTHPFEKAKKYSKLQGGTQCSGE